MEKNQEVYDEQRLLDEYKQIQKVLRNESELETQIQESSSLLDTLLKIESEIRRLSIFSINESYDEIKEEFLEMIDLPFYIALASQKVQVDRIKYIKESEKYFKIFLNLLMHYANCPKLVEDILEEYNDNEKYQIKREKKIELYKLEKTLKTEVQTAKKKSYKEYCTVNSKLKAVEAMNKILFFPQEIQLLEYREKLNKDPELKKKYEKEKSNYKPPKLNFFKYEGKKKPNEIIEKYLIERGIKVPEHLQNKEIENIHMKPNLDR